MAAKSGVVKVDWLKWNKDIVVDVLLQIQSQGDFAGNGFKKNQWNAIEEEFKNHSGLLYSRKQLQNYYAELKKKFGVFSILKDNSGFGWDEAKQVIFIITQRQIASQPTYFISNGDRKSTRLNSSHPSISRMPSSA